MWRLVTDGIATLHEIESYWSITDVLDANEALDVKGDVDEWRARQARELAARDKAIAEATKGAR